MGSHVLDSRKSSDHFRWFYVAGLVLIGLAAVWIWSLIRDDLLADGDPIDDLAVVDADGSAIDLSSSFIVRLSATDVQRQLDDPDTILLDVRPSSDYTEGHIPGAVSIPMATLEDRVHELNRDSEIILVCGNGQLSLRAAMRLLELGFARVFTLDGGINAWLLANLRLCTHC